MTAAWLAQLAECDEADAREARRLDVLHRLLRKPRPSRFPYHPDGVGVLSGHRYGRLSDWEYAAIQVATEDQRKHADRMRLVDGLRRLA